MKRLAVLLALVVLIAWVSPSLAAAPAPTMPNPFTDMGILPPSRVPHARLPLYDAPGVSAYQVDGDYRVLDISSRMWLAITNAMLLLTGIIVKLGIRATEWAFTLSLINSLVSQLDRALGALATAVWDARLVQVAIVCAGMWAAWVGLVLRRTAQALGILITVVVLVALATWSFAGGLTWGLKFVNTASTELSGVVLSGLSRVSGASNAPTWEASEAFTSAGEAVWKVFVAQPWAIAEFGSLTAAMNHTDGAVPGDRLLSRNGTERSRYYSKLPPNVKEQDFAWWKEDAVIPRLVVSFLALLTGVTFGVLLIGMAGAVLTFQALAVLVVVAAPLVFLAGLFLPAYGGYIVSKWALKILGALTTKVVFAAMLSLVLVFSTIIYEVAEPYGWAAASLLQLVLVAAVVMKWRAMFGFFSGLPASPEKALLRLSEWHEPQMIRTGRTVATAAVTGAVGGAVTEGVTYLKEYKARREAVETLNQRLTLDRMRAEDGGRRTPLMKAVAQRLQKGARQPWTDAEIRAEMERNRQLHIIGANPRAVASGKKADKDYYAQVEQVERGMQDTEARIQRARLIFEPRVQEQARARRFNPHEAPRLGDMKK